MGDLKRKNVILTWMLFVALALVEGSSASKEAEDSDADVANSNGPDFSDDLQHDDVQSEEGDLEAREGDATRALLDTKELKDVATKRQKDGWSERCQRCVTKSETIEDKREKMDEAKANYKKAGAN